MSEGYNGCANWATWSVISTLDNMAGWYQDVIDLVRTDEPDDADDVRKYVEKLLFSEPDGEMHPSEKETLRGWRRYMSQEEFDTVDWEEVRVHFRD